MPGRYGVTVVTMLVCFFHCTRGCGRIARPAFPAPSEFQKAERFWQTSRETRGENAKLCLRRSSHSTQDSIAIRLLNWAKWRKIESNQSGARPRIFGGDLAGSLLRLDRPFRTPHAGQTGRGRPRLRAVLLLRAIRCADFAPRRASARPAQDRARRPRRGAGAEHDGYAGSAVRLRTARRGLPAAQHPPHRSRASIHRRRCGAFADDPRRRPRRYRACGGQTVQGFLDASAWAGLFLRGRNRKRKTARPAGSRDAR